MAAEIPAVTFTVSDEQFNSLLRLANLYRREARRCLDAKAYVAGSVMVGAALEALLMALVHVREDEVVNCPNLPTRKGQVRPLLQWDLSALLRVANYAGWLSRRIPDDDDFSHRRADRGDYARIIHQCRNLVHPTRYLEDFSSMRMTKKRLEFLLDVLGHLGEHLAGVAFRLSDLDQSERDQPTSEPV